MKIINRITNKPYIFDRVLQMDDLTKININDGEILQYTGIYYKPNMDNGYPTQIKTKFIGKVETNRGTDGITTGIYIMPLYIWNIISNEWNVIINYKPPSHKYFYYPHLLMLPDYSYHHCPLHFLYTCENKTDEDFSHITIGFDLSAEYPFFESLLQSDTI